MDVATLIQNRISQLGGIDAGHTLALILRGRQDAAAGQVFGINQPNGAQGPVVVVNSTEPALGTAAVRSSTATGIGMGIGF